MQKEKIKQIFVVPVHVKGIYDESDERSQKSGFGAEVILSVATACEQILPRFPQIKALNQ